LSVILATWSRVSNRMYLKSINQPSVAKIADALRAACSAPRNRPAPRRMPEPRPSGKVKTVGVEAQRDFYAVEHISRIGKADDAANQM
jgi:hypothetical protein